MIGLPMNWRGHTSYAPVPRQSGDLGEEIENDHRDRQRDHQEVDAVAARCNGAAQDSKKRGDDNAGGGRGERVPAQVLAARGMDEVRHREAGDGVDPGLPKRDHPAVAGKEDEARGGYTQPQGLGQDLGEREAVDDRRRAGEKKNQRAKGDQLRNPDAAADAAHAGRPNKPSGRTARTATTRMNVSRIA